MRRREFLLGSCAVLGAPSKAEAAWASFMAAGVGGGGSPPANTALPTVSPSTPVVGTPEAGANGAWTGSPTSFSYQWNWADASAPISGATSVSYNAPVSADIGHTLSLTVGATNAYGTTYA